ncbi:MAG: sigma-70 family RNA polymerase sigma factor [Clostridia bacterium]|nr:sigma-70 family RNA polymerase sigma factor [Clostridia bacterium]
MKELKGIKMKEYVKRFKLNDYSLFNEFYQKTCKQVYFTALGILKNHTHAEDIMQETFVAFLEKIDSVKENENILSYLTVIARNKSINEYNKGKRIESDQTKLETLSTESDFDNNGVESILSLLEDDEEREIIVYHLLIGYKFKEISAIIHKPLGTVLWKYNKAIKYLKTKKEIFYEQ